VRTLRTWLEAVALRFQPQHLCGGEGASSGTHASLSRMNFMTHSKSFVVMEWSRGPRPPIQLESAVESILQFEMACFCTVRDAVMTQQATSSRPRRIASSFQQQTAASSVSHLPDSTQTQERQPAPLHLLNCLSALLFPPFSNNELPLC
jgi:hypothetical protein